MGILEYMVGKEMVIRKWDVTKCNVRGNAAIEEDKFSLIKRSVMIAVTLRKI